MRYDFETLTDRSSCGAYKYMEMHELYPDIPKTTVPFSMADMEFQNPPELRNALKEYIDSYTMGYCGATAGYLKAVSDWQKNRHGWEVKPEWIIPIPGALPGIFAVMQEFAEKGEGVIYFSPVFGWFKGGAELNQRKPVPCSLKENQGKLEIDYDQFEALAADPNNKIVLLCNPHNPTGHIWNRENLTRIADICLKHDLILVSDEVHADLIMPGYHQISMGAMDEKYRDNLIVAIAPSKTFNSAGMQAANLVVFRQDWKARLMRRLQSNGVFTLTALGFVTLETVYNQCGGWLDQCIEYVWENHKLLKDFVTKRMPGVVAFDLEATYLQWMDFRAVVKTHEELKEKLHKAQVIMDQGTDFGPEGDRFERMNLACPRHVLLDALERMAKALYD